VSCFSREDLISNRDTLFKNPKSTEPFEFNDSVARVFDDMLQRSVPMYQECQDLAVHWCAKYAKPSTSVYDLGCSTGKFLLKLAEELKHPKDIKLIGLDNSSAMLKKARETLKNSPLSCAMVEADLNKTLSIENASVIVMNYTLQFVKSDNRRPLLKSIYDGLVSGGSLILIEKVKSEIPDLNETFIEFHHQFKEENGYSKLEISQKREALENVLIPWTVEQNSELIQSAGFSTVDLFFKWNNFAGFIALK
jgi:tRNA (cmo5U34)-methyltransferase